MENANLDPQDQQASESIVVDENAAALNETAAVADQNNSDNANKSRIYGIIGIIAFWFLGGFEDCAWYLWIVIAILGIYTINGESRKTQALLSAILIAIAIFNYTPSTSADDSSSVSNEVNQEDPDKVFREYNERIKRERAQKIQDQLFF